MPISDIDPKHRDQIERWLDRPLSDGELQPVASLAELTDEQLAVVAAIQPRNLITPLLFVRAVLPRGDFAALSRFIDDIASVVAARQPPREWSTCRSSKAALAVR